MRIHIIACEVMLREICYAVARAPHPCDPVFIRKGLHDNPDVLREELRSRLATVDPARADVVVLGYGLCSNGTAGLQAGQIPLVIPKMHDCITMFLGSRSRYADLFGQHPGTYYYTKGWLERGADQVAQPARQGGGLMDQTFQELVARYGEDNARYLMEIQGGWVERYTRACLIRMPIYPADEDEAKVREIAAQHGWEYAEVEGDMRLFEAMVGGDWSEEDFLVVPPGGTIQPSYDDHVLKYVGGCQACRVGQAVAPLQR